MKFQDTGDGTVLCRQCGHESMTNEGAQAHWKETHGTENRSLAEGERSSALTGVAPQSVSVDKDTGSSQPAHPPISTFLPIGAFRTSDHQYYFNGQGPEPGATSVLEVLSKPALVTWKAQEAARAMHQMLIQAAPAPAPDTSQQEMVNAALKAADQQRDTAAKLGSSIHLLADMASRGSESDSKAFHVSKEEIPYLDAWQAFCAFLTRHRGSIVSSEHMVWSLNGYGGTYDLIVEFQTDKGMLHPELWLIDIKTSKGYYPEYGLQLAAYRWADSIILEGNPTPFPMPEIHRAGVLHLRPDQYPDTGWRLIEYPITYEKDYMAFLGALEIYKWRKEGRFLKSNLNPVTGTEA